jgi:predicted nucleotidyltransferase
VIRDLRQAVVEAKAAHLEIVKVLLFGSFVQGSWTADSDTDLIVVVRKELSVIHGVGLIWPDRNGGTKPPFHLRN